jgi:hypothetical protein
MVSADQHHEGLGQRVGVRERDQEAGGAPGCEKGAGLVVEFDDRRGEVRIQPLDKDSARRIFRHLSQHAYGVATTLPGSTITPAELGIASDSGAIQAAALVQTIAGPTATG